MIQLSVSQLSGVYCISCDIHQESCLGPLLFLMYINDLPQASKFQATLFVDDTYLCLSDTNINNLQIRVNVELQNINLWLRKNRLSLNYNKTNFMLINKHPNKTAKCDFKPFPKLCSTKQNQQREILGVYLDDKLKWTSHLKHLLLQLAQYPRLFYCIRNLYQTIFCYTTVLCIVESNMA